eukprot:26939_1
MSRPTTCINHMIERYRAVNLNNSKLSTVDRDITNFYLPSCVGGKWLLLIEFKNECNLHEITVYAQSGSPDTMNTYHSQQITVYKPNTLNMNPNEMRSIDCNSSIQRSVYKLNVGQTSITDGRNKSIFTNTKYLIILIESSEQRHVYGFQFHGHSKCVLPDDKRIVLSSVAEFDRIIGSTPDQLIVIQFYASWCPHSCRIAPQFKKLSNTYTDATFLQVDIDKFGEIAKHYKISSTPTFRFMKNQKVLNTVEGANIRNVIQSILQYT